MTKQTPATRGHSHQPTIYYASLCVSYYYYDLNVNLIYVLTNRILITRTHSYTNTLIAYTTNITHIYFYNIFKIKNYLFKK